MPSDKTNRCPDCGELKFRRHKWGGRCTYCGYTESEVMDIEHLRDLRIIRANWSAEGLAMSINRSKAQVYCYERGEMLPSLESFREICKVLDLGAEDVYRLLMLDKKC